MHALAHPLLTPKWITRLVLGLVFVVVVVLALMDFQAKRSAKQTADAWLERIESEEAFEDADLDALMVGDPAIEVQDLEKGYERVTDYTWKGTLRSYRVTVTTVSPGGAIKRVEGPINE